MTDADAARLESHAPPPVLAPLPEPLPPVEVLQLLAQQSPLGEHSVDAF